MKNMPDVANESSAAHKTESAPFAPIDQVGMGGIEVPVLLASEDHTLFRVPAKVSAKVSLDIASSRGIHMSRLYLLVQEMLSQKPLSYSLLKALTDAFLATHKDLSRHAYVDVHFELPLQRKALKSNNTAWRSYPVRVSVQNDQGSSKVFAEALVTYSSTCPASAALARQLIQEQFGREFSQSSNLDSTEILKWLGTAEGVVATPHAQRSEAKVQVQLKDDHSAFGFETLINVVEEALQTPVQAAVKREDEQEFALRNGQNLMFCEDAARRIQTALDARPDVVGYRIDVKHLESLHPHNAEATIAKGVNFPS